MVILVHQVLDVLVFSSADDGYDRCIDPIPCCCKYDLRMILNDFNISDAHCCFLFAGRSYKITISDRDLFDFLFPSSYHFPFLCQYVLDIIFWHLFNPMLLSIYTFCITH